MLIKTGGEWGGRTLTRREKRKAVYFPLEGTKFSMRLVLKGKGEKKKEAFLSKKEKKKKPLKVKGKMHKKKRGVQKVFTRQSRGKKSRRAG